MIVLNGEPFIKYNLENLYPYAHEIIIVEGAVEKFRHAATSDGHSIDNTVKIIKTFPDPEHKIKLIQRNGFWEEKDEMSNAYMKACTGDYIWQVDVDEFYKRKDILKLKHLLTLDPEISRVDIKSISFWRSFQAIMQGASYIYGADNFVRIFQFKAGYRYLTHRPPTLLNEKGDIVSHHKFITAQELSEKYGIVMYHYSYVFPEIVYNKSHYYSQMGWGNGCEEGLKWAQSFWRNFHNPLRIHLIKFPPSWLVPFDGTHPKIITKMIREIHFEEDMKILRFLRHKAKQFACLGDKIINLYLKVELGEIGKIKAFFAYLTSFVLPITIMRINADRTIADILLRTLTLPNRKN